MLSRRDLLAGSATLTGAATLATRALAAAPPLARGLPQGVADVATLEALPGKKPLIKLSYRPPNYETPVSYFTDAITPNDAFFVRYHLSDIPEIDPPFSTPRAGTPRLPRVFEAPIGDADAATIKNYLSRNYGK